MTSFISAHPLATDVLHEFISEREGRLHPPTPTLATSALCRLLVKRAAAAEDLEAVLTLFDGEGMSDYFTPDAPQVFSSYAERANRSRPRQLAAVAGYRVEEAGALA